MEWRLMPMKMKYPEVVVSKPFIALNKSPQLVFTYLRRHSPTSSSLLIRRDINQTVLSLHLYPRRGRKGKIEMNVAITKGNYGVKRTMVASSTAASITPPSQVPCPAAPPLPPPLYSRQLEWGKDCSKLDKTEREVGIREGGSIWDD
ncbi:unnamed protein product [Linum trigynum]|uniref:Uncharacterized protein n=1 Tax=Linum trigynum TaxID=586398 RepID=A0AAV2EAI3_9ROSI